MGKARKPTPPTAGESPAPAVPATASNVEAVVFVRAHKHAGVDYVAGEDLFVTPEERELLRRFGAIGEN